MEKSGEIKKLEMPVTGVALDDLRCELNNMKKLGYSIKSGGINGMYELLNAQSKGKFGGAFWACKADGTECNYVLKIQYIKTKHDTFVNEFFINEYIKSLRHIPFSPNFFGGFACNVNDVIEKKLESLEIINNCGSDFNKEKCKFVGYLLFEKFGKDLQKNNYVNMEKIINELNILENQKEPLLVLTVTNKLKELFNNLVFYDPDSLYIKNHFDEFINQLLIKKNIQDDDIKKEFGIIYKKNYDLLLLMNGIQASFYNVLSTENNIMKIFNDKNFKKSISDTIKKYINEVMKENNYSNYLYEIIEIKYSSINIANFFNDTLKKLIEYNNNLIIKIEKFNTQIMEISRNTTFDVIYNLSIKLQDLNIFNTYSEIYNPIKSLSIIINRELLNINVDKNLLIKFSTEIKNKNNIDPPITKDVIYEIFNKIGEMHNIGIIHGDTGLRNVLFKKSTNNGTDILLADFGLAAIIDLKNKYYNVWGRKIIKNIYKPDKIDIDNYIILNKIFDYADIYYDLTKKYYKEYLHNLSSDNFDEIQNKIINIFINNLVITKLKDFIQSKQFICDYNIKLFDDTKYTIKDSVFYKTADRKRDIRSLFINLIKYKIIRLINNNELEEYIKDNYKTIKINNDIIINFSNKFRSECMY